MVRWCLRKPSEQLLVLLRPSVFHKHQRESWRRATNWGKHATMLLCYTVFWPAVTLTVNALLAIAIYHQKCAVKTASSPLEYCTSNHRSPASPGCIWCLSLCEGGQSMKTNLIKRTRWWLMVARPTRDTGTALKANMCHSFYCVRAPLLFPSPSPLCLHFS